MDFWRAYRVLARRKWMIIAAVSLTTLVVAVGIMLFGRQYEATTIFGPTDQAVLRTVMAATDGRGDLSTFGASEARGDEVNRVATGVVSQDTIQSAVQYLVGAPALRTDIETVFELDSPLGGDGRAPRYEDIRRRIDEAIYEVNGTGNIVRDSETGEPKPVTVEDGQGNTVARYLELERRHGIPHELWADMIYLAGTLDAVNADMSFRERPVQTIQRLLAQQQDMPVKLNSREVLLTLRHKDPRVAEAFASAMTAVYKYQYDRQNSESAEKQLSFYKGQYQRANAQYTAAQKALSTWRKNNNQLFLPDQVDNAVKKANDAKSSLEGITASLKDVDAQIAATKARQAGLPKMITRETRTQDPEAAQLRAELASLEAGLARDRGNYTEKHPDVVLAKSKIDSIKQRLQQVQGRMVTNKTEETNPEWERLDQEVAKLVQTRNGLAARIGTLNQVMQESNGLLARLPDSSTRGQILSSTFASAAETLKEASQKLRVAQENMAKSDAEGALQVRYWAGPFNSSERQEIPAREGGLKRNVGMIVAAFVLSLLASAGIILGLDYMDTSIKTPVDVERMLDVPVNGIVPRLDGPSRAMLPQVTHALPASPHAESYRFLGTDILLSANGEDPYKSIMVATAKPGQGGTSTICNLAITLAQAGQSVVLVDADLRRPSLHQVFNLDNEQGLTTVLGNGRLSSDVLQRTEVENLYVMTGGPQTDNAWKLLHSTKMRDVITDLSRDFDFVLFDTPSAVVFADAATLATMVDGVLLVVRAHESPTGSELQVKNLLNKTRARIVGVVLNDMPAQQVDSARFFNHYYAQERPSIGTKTASGPKVALPRQGSDDEI